MKIATGLRIFVWALVSMTPVLGGNLDSSKLIDCGTAKVAIFDDTVSPDGQHAIGWSIIPNKKKVAPVDWSQWKTGSAIDMVEKYGASGSGEATPDDDYLLINCVVDIQNKKMLSLETDEPDFPGKNRGYLSALWGAKNKGVQYALVQIDSRFWTNKLWLVTIDSSGMHQTDLTDRLNKAVIPILKEKMPLRYERYATFFPLQDSDAPKPPAAIDGSTATLSFSSAADKSLVDPIVEGTVVVHLPDGAIVKTSSPTKRDDPFEDIPELAKADQKLNQNYAKLQKSLSPANREALKKEQLDWIEKRDSDAFQAANDDTANDPDKARNKSLLDATNDRADELEARLEQPK